MDLFVFPHVGSSAVVIYEAWASLVCPHLRARTTDTERPWGRRSATLYAIGEAPGARSPLGGGRSARRPLLHEGGENGRPRK